MHTHLPMCNSDTGVKSLPMLIFWAQYKIQYKNKGSCFYKKHFRQADYCFGQSVKVFGLKRRSRRHIECAPNIFKLYIGESCVQAGERANIHAFKIFFLSRTSSVITRWNHLQFATILVKICSETLKMLQRVLRTLRPIHPEIICRYCQVGSYDQTHYLQGLTVSTTNVRYSRAGNRKALAVLAGSWSTDGVFKEQL